MLFTRPPHATFPDSKAPGIGHPLDRAFNQVPKRCARTAKRRDEERSTRGKHLGFKDMEEGRGGDKRPSCLEETDWWPHSLRKGKGKDKTMRGYHFLLLAGEGCTESKQKKYPTQEHDTTRYISRTPFRLQL